MKTNLIQNFINTQNTPPSKKEAPEFNIHHELANKTFIRPLKGRGKLVSGSLFDAPEAFVKSISYDINSLKSGIKGDANDHQLGKLNDLGMKLGGLSIAGFLFTKRPSPLTKTMEFVGLGSFFASMALWPKIAIQLPARLIHGFNVQQQYEDSFGRKKLCFQDPQFIPWDLYSDEQINKIGDRMGVPRNIPNRREFIQEKMKKIAIQNNTLWMLTAGFATPVMSALICNQLEKPLAKPLSSSRHSNNNYLLKNFNQAVKDSAENKILKNYKDFLRINQNKPLTDKLIQDLARTLSEGFHTDVNEALCEDLKTVLGSDKYVINTNSISAMSDGIRQKLIATGLDADLVEKFAPTTESLAKYFEDEKGYFGNTYDKAQIEKIFKEYTLEFREKIKKYNEQNPNAKISDIIVRRIRNDVLLAPNETNPIYKGLTKETAAELTPKNIKLLDTIANAMNSLRNKTTVLDKYIHHNFGEDMETSMADFWNKTFRTYVDSLKLTKEQLEIIKTDKNLGAEIIRTAYDNIAADKKAYGEFTTKLLAQLNKINTQFKPTDTSDNIFLYKNVTEFDKTVDKVFNSFVEELSKNPDLKSSQMKSVLDRMLDAKTGSLKNFYKEIIRTRIASVKSSFFRIINTMDLYRRIAVGDKTYTPALHSGMRREAKEELVELCKQLGIDGHTSDYFTKFFARRNPDYLSEDFSDIEIKNGKPVYKYLDTKRTSGRVQIPQDSDFFKEAMRLMYQNNLSPETETAFGKNKNLLEEFKSYRKQMMNNVGNIPFIENPRSLVGDAKTEAPDKLLSLLIGAPTEEAVTNYSKQVHNTKSWLKMFGIFGAGLLGVTVLAQFFFGRIKAPTPISENKKGNINA